MDDIVSNILQLAKNDIQNAVFKLSKSDNDKSIYFATTELFDYFYESGKIMARYKKFKSFYVFFYKKLSSLNIEQNSLF